MKNKIKLSICIPTYNFGKYIIKTLESIYNQNSNHLEVIILDGASNDDTNFLVKKFISINNLNNFFYLKMNERGGIFKDVNKLITLANGYYIWLISADDVLESNIINLIFDKLNHDYDILLTQHYESNIYLENKLKYKIMNFDKDKLFNLRNKNDYQNYFKKSLSSETFFTFLSTPIFKKKIWKNNFLFDKRCSPWVVAINLLENIAQKNIKIYYFSNYFLTRRGGNDSFLINDDLIRRYLLNIIEFKKVFSHFFHSKIQIKYLDNIIQNDITLRHLLNLKSSLNLTKSKQKKLRFNFLCNKIYHNNFFKKCLVIYFPIKLWLFLKKIKNV